MSAERIVATDTALAAIERLQAEHGNVMFFLSGGCCDGSSLICLREGELLIGPNDLLLGEVSGAEFFVDLGQYERWGRPRFMLDVAPGDGAEFSLPAGERVHLILRTA